MSAWQFIRHSLLFHWRINCAVALGVAAATAVLTGALLVGDSVRGGLRWLALDRLGQIDAILIADRFFRDTLATSLVRPVDGSPQLAAAVPAIIFPQGTLEKQGDGQVRRTSHVMVVGSDASFWDLGRRPISPDPLPGEGEIVLNQPLADDLGANVGDQVVLRLPKVASIPAESPLGEKQDRIRGIPRLKVVCIIPAVGLGRFALTSSQSGARNAFVSLSTLQTPLEQPGKVNAIFVSRADTGTPLTAEQCRQLSKQLTPSLADLGLSIKRARLAFRPTADAPEQTIFDYVSVISDRMVLDEPTEEVVLQAFAENSPQPISTYLANAMFRVDATGPSASDTLDQDIGIPYSTVAAVDSIAGLGPLLGAQKQPIGPLKLDEIVLNQWAAEDLGAQLGDTIRLVYFQPETTHGRTVEAHADFTLQAVVPLTEPAEPSRDELPSVYDERPTLVNDPDLTPEVRGVTDQQSIARWDVPFELTRTIRPKDDTYYQNHRLTPKAFVSLAAGKKLWGSRFGNLTSVRFPTPPDWSVQETDDRIEQTSNRLLNQIRQSDVTLGLDFRPIRAQSLAASRGTTPFDVLFLALSFFVIAAALMLVALLFRLGIDQRAAQIGVLLATGLSRRLTRRLLLGEATVVAASGGGLGVVAGMGYAQVMLMGLRRGWWGKSVAPALHFDGRPTSLVLGYALGLVVSVLTIVWSLRQLRREPVVQLLAGHANRPLALTSQRHQTSAIVAVVLLLMATGLLIAAVWLGGQAQAGAFVGGGALVLTAALVLVWRGLRYGRTTQPVGVLSLLALAKRGAGRNPIRSTTTIGLMASASFLIVAMSSFRLAPTQDGTGGFDFVAESSAAILADLSSEQGREQLLGDRATLLKDCVVLPLRSKPGDDASCNNLYKANQPRVLGVTSAMVEHFENPETQPFSWAASAGQSEPERANPWRLLDKTLPDGRVPVVIDKNTAMYGLQLYGGIGQEFEVVYDPDITVRFRVVGLLSNTVLQGNLLIAEKAFQQQFKEVPGYGYFLIQCPPAVANQVAQTLEEALGDQGFDASSAMQLLDSLLAVQNTYLSTFQSLGALGLLLGTFGLATVQLRNVVERRSELALLRSVGFGRRRLMQMVSLENLLLLWGGLGVGVLAALWAVLPHMVFGDASIPFRDLAIMLGVVMLVGMLTSLVAVRAALRAPLLSALRGD